MFRLCWHNTNTILFQPPQKNKFLHVDDCTRCQLSTIVRYTVALQVFGLCIVDCILETLNCMSTFLSQFHVSTTVRLILFGEGALKKQSGKNYPKNLSKMYAFQATHEYDPYWIGCIYP